MSIEQITIRPHYHYNGICKLADCPIMVDKRNMLVVLSFCEDRHQDVIEGIDAVDPYWRMKDRMKTVSVALVLCLNIGVNPPDIVKTHPCARLECWIDPLSLPSPKGLEKIGATLQQQYERWQPRARYKQSLDPTTEDIKKLCVSLRRNAKEERVLFHYNGHGVPKPTTNGEIWVFNRTYTQYIPLSIYDLQTWMGSPSIYVYDCSNAGTIIESFKTFAYQHEREYEQQQQHNTNSGNSSGDGRPTTKPNFADCIQLAACSCNEILPMKPDLPADLFTACLTTPIKVAIQWFMTQSTSKLDPKLTPDIIDRIPGQMTDRRTMMGELNWIFTAITDTIAWNTLERDVFQKLFRQDLLVASLCRNFLLAQRVLKSVDCTPTSAPPMPAMWQHPMWQVWDVIVNLSLNQLPAIIEDGVAFEHSTFFEEQLSAFEVWLQWGGEKRQPPEQLPIVLQVLLSQVHRMRALDLLAQFIDIGPWAIDLSLYVGIFPYILKLLQANTKELQPLLVYIWSKILAVDCGCQVDLVHDNGHKYFLNILQDPTSSEKHRTESAFILAHVVNEYRDGQEAALQDSLLTICLEQLNDPNAELRLWVVVCLGRLWDGYEKARWIGVRDMAHEKLYILLKDPVPEVRAATVYALGTFINSVGERSEHANNIDHTILLNLIKYASCDMNYLVRKELLNALQWVVIIFEHIFLRIISAQESSISSDFENIVDQQVAKTNHSDSLKRVSSTSSINNLVHTTFLTSGFGSVYQKIWLTLCQLEHDPHPEVGHLARTIIKHLHTQLAQETVVVKDINNKKSSIPTASAATDCLSLPPSPKKNYLLLGSNHDSIHLSSTKPIGSSRSTTTFRKKGQISISEEDTTMNQEPSDDVRKKPLVRTKFVEWACRKFVENNRCVFAPDPVTDIESSVFCEYDWRSNRNTNIRREAADEQRRCLVHQCRLDTLLFNTRTMITPPLVVRFHPYDQQVAVAGKAGFGIWDWGTGAKTTLLLQSSRVIRSMSNVKLTSMEWINAHDVGLLITGGDDGAVKVWRPNLGQPQLITAWQSVHTNRNMIKSSSAHTPSNDDKLSVVWEQYKGIVITGGMGRTIRLWDAHAELHLSNIVTGIESNLVALTSSFSGGNTDCGTDVIVAGFQNGTVKMYDKRMAGGGGAYWLDHTGPIVGVQLYGAYHVISASSTGDIKEFDVRQSGTTLRTVRVQCANNEINAFAMHRLAHIYACGTSSAVQLFTLAGTQLNTIKMSEGFMGTHRSGASITSLAFHPYRVVLAAAMSDCSLSVYTLEKRSHPINATITTTTTTTTTGVTDR